MISQDRYVKITSGVGGGASVRTRQLIMRLISVSEKIAPTEIREFTSADGVMQFFGVNSEEYLRARQYFAFISKSVRAPQAISFVRWVNQAIPPSVKGVAGTASLANVQAISAGTIRFIFDGEDPVEVNGINLSTATDLTHAATLITAQLQTSANQNLATSTMTYDAATFQFIWTGGVATNVTVDIPVIGGASDLGAVIGLSADGAINTDGQNREGLDSAASRTTEADNNFGSLVVTHSVPVPHIDLLNLAKWNATKNNMYILSLSMSLASVRADEFADFTGIAGLAITLTGPSASDYTDQIPCEILAATDYDAPNATQNYMYYQFATRGVAVSTDLLADEMDEKFINYIGVTQTAGQKLAFYQRGVLFGGANDARDMNVYANEMWLKDYIASKCLSAFLSLPTVPANDIGRNMLITILQDCVGKAKDNGVISVGKAINTTQQLYISQISGDRMAWHQVATIGYWYNIEFLERTGKNGKVEWYAKYILVYAKDDAIRAVEGQDVLI